MNDFTCMYPVEVTIKESENHKEKKALMYSIYPDDNGIPCATCWLVELNNWLTCPLSYVKPKLDNIKTIKINENL